MIPRELLITTLPVLEEVAHRAQHPLYGYKPDNHKERDQEAFHKSKSLIRLVFGGNQSGKSYSVANEIAWWLLGIHPYIDVSRPEPVRVYCLSASYRTVQEGVYRHLKDILPRWEVKRYGSKVVGWDMPSFIELRNGARVDFISGDGHEEARKKIQAAAIDLAVVDEEIEDSLYRELLPRLLARSGRLVVSATLVNSKQWCLELEDRAEKADPEVALVRLSSYRAQRCGHISKRVLKEMEASYSEDERKVRLEGRSRRNQGLVYPEFSHKHVIPAETEFTIPKDWTRFCAIDPGFRTFAALWVACSPDGKYVVYREIYEHASHVHEIAKKILALEGYEPVQGTLFWRAAGDRTEEMYHRWIDPSGFGHHETGEIKTAGVLAQLSSEFGVGNRLACAPANNDIQLGIARCRRDLQPDFDGVPKMRVLSTCENFIKEMRSYRFSLDQRSSQQNEPRDLPVKRNDHLLDCWRYIVNGGVGHYKDIENFQSAPYQVTHDMGHRMKRHFERLNAKSRGDTPSPAHVGGLGSEY